MEYTYTLKALCEQVQTKKDLIELISSALYVKHSCRTHAENWVSMKLCEWSGNTIENLFSRLNKAMKGNRYQSLVDVYHRSRLASQCSYYQESRFIYDILRYKNEEDRLARRRALGLSPSPLSSFSYTGQACGRNHTLDDDSLVIVVTDKFLSFVQRTEIEIITD